MTDFMNFKTLVVLIRVGEDVLNGGNCLPAFSKKLFNSSKETDARIVSDFDFPGQRLTGPKASSFTSGPPFNEILMKKLYNNALFMSSLYL